MIYWTSGSAVIEAVLTEKGKEILALGSENFNITKFSVFDDEIDYTLAEASITATNIMPPIMFPNSIKYNLITQPKGSLTVPVISPIGNVNISGTGTSNPVIISTLNGSDSNNGYTVRCNTNNIILQTINDKFNIPNATAFDEKTKFNKRTYAFNSGDINNQVITVENTFLIKSLNKAGTYTIDIIGNNSGASLSINVVITYVDYSLYISQIKAISEL